MKVTIPDELKASIPQTMWGRILSATPIVMAVLATMLAGLASSEMTKRESVVPWRNCSPRRAISGAFSRPSASARPCSATRWTCWMASSMSGLSARRRSPRPPTRCPTRSSLAGLQLKAASTKAAAQPADAPKAQAMQQDLAYIQEHKAQAEHVKTEIIAALQADVPAA